MDAAAGSYMPQRLNALVRYGEGPHLGALSVIRIALGLAWVALRSRRPAALPGEHSVRLVFETPLENTVGAMVTLASLLVVAWLLWRSRQ